MGSQRRLPNGNTFIVEDNTGRLFQVKPDGEIVWEYVNRGGTTRPFPVPYDFTPQLRELTQPESSRSHHPTTSSGTPSPTYYGIINKPSGPSPASWVDVIFNVSRSRIETVPSLVLAT